MVSGFKGASAGSPRAPGGSGSNGATLDRRRFIRMGLGAAAAIPAAGLLAACGSGSAPSGAAAADGQGSPIRIGFIALTDCASIVMAEHLGLFRDRGLNVQVIKQASWPATRDNLLNGQIDAAHCLFSLPLSLAAGIGGRPENKLKIAMMLSQNGQAITLSNDLRAAGYGDLAAAREALAAAAGGGTMAMTFPGGTHDTWLRYWLRAAGLGNDDLKIVPIPPPQMVANMKVGSMEGYSVGEPWNAQGVQEEIGFTAITSQDIWQHHPEKALVVNPDFAERRTRDLQAAMGAILEAGRWLDAGPAHRSQAAQAIGVPAFVGAAPSVIEGRMLGRYQLGAGLGDKTYTDDLMNFHRDGQVNFPRKAHAIWFLAQFQRFGYLNSAPDYRAIADNLILSGLYRQVAEQEGVAVPDDDMAPFEVRLDGVEFDPTKPELEATR